MSKTPPQPLLQYRGGKRRYVKEILANMPPVDEVVSPFVGAGSVELALAAGGVRVHAYDMNTDVVNWWRCVLEDPGRVADEAEKYPRMSRQQYYWWRNNGYRRLPGRYERAGLYFVLHRTSWGGIGPHGGYGAGTLVSRRSLDALRAFSAPGLTVSRAHYERSLGMHPESFAFCDPPYFTSSTYGRGLHKIDHRRLAAILTARGGFMLTIPRNRWVNATYPSKTCEIVDFSQRSFGIAGHVRTHECMVIDRRPSRD